MIPSVAPMFVVASRPIVVGGPFRVLLVDHAVRMHRERLMRVVSEKDLDRVADDPSDDGSEEAQMLPLGRSRLQGFEGAVGILPIEHLRVGGGDPFGSRLEVPDRLELGSGDVVSAAGDVIPRDFIGRHVVHPHLTGGCRSTRVACPRRASGNSHGTSK